MFCIYKILFIISVYHTISLFRYTETIRFFGIPFQTGIEINTVIPKIIFNTVSPRACDYAIEAVDKDSIPLLNHRKALEVCRYRETSDWETIKKILRGAFEQQLLKKCHIYKAELSQFCRGKSPTFVKNKKFLVCK
ncbi:Uncharacterized protein FWK35_00018183 [Aphis craccivora]|uniref:Uncharacterized protein n=1 Tax=Aphis craccivora TaxID=307492 RepID=A0A6G0WA30_APHCR|nr:Uncharacterized protein FWK35_00018183 [Aphis craccivora]